MKSAVAAFLAALLLSAPAFACTVCMGGTSSDLRKGFYWGILLLLLLPVTMASVFIYKVYRASRKKSQPDTAHHA